MAVNATHPEYDAAAPQWSRARDVLAGEDAVKAAGVKYLPRMDSQSDEEYAAYVARAGFVGAAARTLEEYLDLVFRRSPSVSVGRGLGALTAGSLTGYLRRVVREVLSVGRAGSLVSLPSAGAGVSLALFRAEDILNWSVGQDGALSRLVLRNGECLLVFTLASGECWCQSWARSGDEWMEVGSERLERAGSALSFIPFVFHGARGSEPEPDRLPLADIISANLDHYRLDADLKHGAHFAALPTAWVSGFDKGTVLRIGSSAAWVSELPDASAGFLEFSGSGLAFVERAIERVERRMAGLGARMLEAPSPESESGQRTEVCGLLSVVVSLNESLTRALQLAHFWAHKDAVVADPSVSVSLNTEFVARAMSGENLSAVVAAWRAGAISRESMLEALKRGEVLPDGRTVAQERALIHRSGAAVG